MEDHNEMAFLRALEKDLEEAGAANAYARPKEPAPRTALPKGARPIGAYKPPQVVQEKKTEDILPAKKREREEEPIETPARQQPSIRQMEQQLTVQTDKFVGSIPASLVEARKRTQILMSTAKNLGLEEDLANCLKQLSDTSVVNAAIAKLQKKGKNYEPWSVAVAVGVRSFYIMGGANGYQQQVYIKFICLGPDDTIEDRHFSLPFDIPTFVKAVRVGFSRTLVFCGKTVSAVFGKTAMTRTVENFEQAFCLCSPIKEKYIRIAAPGVGAIRSIINAAKTLRVEVILVKIVESAERTNFTKMNEVKHGRVTTLNFGGSVVGELSQFERRTYDCQDLRVGEIYGVQGVKVIQGVRQGITLGNDAACYFSDKERLRLLFGDEELALAIKQFEDCKDELQYGIAVARDMHDSEGGFEGTESAQLHACSLS